MVTTSYNKKAEKQDGNRTNTSVQNSSLKTTGWATEPTFNIYGLELCLQFVLALIFLFTFICFN